MASMNKVILAGNLTRDPEVRYTPSGTAVADLGMAISDSYKSKTGELVEQVCFVDVVVWGRQAETSGEYLRKGSPALIEGRLQFDQWEGQDGQKRSKLRVRADRVQFLGGPRREGGEDNSPSNKPTHAEADSANPAKPEAAASKDDDDLPF